MDSKNLKTFLLNLDESKDRLEHMRKTLSALNLLYERVPAVNGASLSSEELAHAFDAKRSIVANRAQMTLGQIGCALSHDLIYRRMESEGIDCALVFEDDIVFSPSFPRALDCVKSSMDVSRPQVFLFSYFRHQESFESSVNAPSFKIVKQKSMACTDAYVITLPAAKLIYRANYPVLTCADSFRRWRRFFGLELYRCLPVTVRQNPLLESEILRIGGGQCHKDVSGLRRLWYTTKDLYDILRNG